MLITYYTKLGISETATPEEIRAAYLRLIKIYHPDRNINSEAETICRKINQAYEVLSDPVRRAKYDTDLWLYRQSHKDGQSTYSASGNTYRETVHSSNSEYQNANNTRTQSSQQKPYKEPTEWEDMIGSIKENKFFFYASVSLIIIIAAILIFATPNDATDYKGYPLHNYELSDEHWTSRETYVTDDRYNTESVPDSRNDYNGITPERREEIFRMLDAAKQGIGTQHEISEKSGTDNVRSVSENRGGTQQIALSGAPKLTKSPYEGNSLSTSFSPYVDLYENYYDPDSWNSITFNNGSQYDAIVFLLDSDCNVVIRHNYIRSGDVYMMKQLPSGRYKLKVYQGKNWNPNESAYSTMPLGRFDNDEIFSKTTKKYDFEIPSSDSENYIAYSITLHKVEDGNLQTKSISRKEMFDMYNSY